MERQRLPLDKQGLPVVPSEVLEINCGGSMCEGNENMACPDNHHLYEQRDRFRHFPALFKLAIHKSMQEPLLRCQHVYLHHRYEPAEPPPPSVVAVEVSRRGINLNRKAKKDLRKRIQEERHEL